MDNDSLQSILVSWPKYKELDTLLKKFLPEGEKWQLQQVNIEPHDPYFPRYELSSGVRPGAKMSIYEYEAALAHWYLFGSFSLMQFPGCCGIMVSYHAKVGRKFQKAGLGTLLNQLRMYIAKCEGYTYLMATDLTTNEPQRKILTKNGWNDLLEFRNHRTGNLLALSIVKV